MTPKLLLCAIVILAGCAKSTSGSNTTGVVQAGDVVASAGQDATPTTGDAVVTTTFGQTCSAPADCGTGGMVCFQFGTGATNCTLPCTSADDCPSGSSGKLCNGKGYCKP